MCVCVEKGLTRKTTTLTCMRNQHACLGRLGKLFVPLGANLLGGSRHRFDRVPGRLGEQGVRTVHVDQIFRARIVAERSVLGLQQEVVPVERIDGAAKRGTKSALLSCSFWGWRLLIACVRACVRAQERENVLTCCFEKEPHLRRPSSSGRKTPPCLRSRRTFDCRSPSGFGCCRWRRGCGT